MENIIGFTARYQNEKARLKVQFYDRLLRTLNGMLKDCQNKKEEEHAKMEATAESAKGSTSRLAYRFARFGSVMELREIKAFYVRLFRNSFDKDVVGHGHSTQPEKPPTCNVYHYPHPSTSSETPAE